MWIGKVGKEKRGQQGKEDAWARSNHEGVVVVTVTRLGWERKAVCLITILTV